MDPVSQKNTYGTTIRSFAGKRAALKCSLFVKYNVVRKTGMTTCIVIALPRHALPATFRKDIFSGPWFCCSWLLDPKESLFKHGAGFNKRINL
eukprot:3012448-Rhodomonas_salina.1